MNNEKVALLILDGVGLAPKSKGNAFKLASTPFIDNLFKKYTNTKLSASGEAVGLQEGQMGDSNVGHLNLGAGRIVWQMLPKINKAVKEGVLESNKVIKNAIKASIKNDRPLHLMGLLSDGGVHSHMKIVEHLLKIMDSHKGLRLAIHVILDGRDVAPKSAKKYIKLLNTWLQQYPFAKVVTVSGRYYTMDRDQRWERTQLSYDAMSNGEGPVFSDANAAIDYYYNKDINDEFIVPSIINHDSKAENFVKKEDQLIFFNFRADRARQITSLLLENEINVIGMTQYQDDLHIPIIMDHDEIKHTIAEWLSLKGLSQLHIAETEKYAHVTFFFNGGREEPFKNEDRILISSPKVATYDLKPEMSAYEITQSTIEKIGQKEYDFIVLNYANGDMVGHTGNIEAAIKAVETIDDNLSKLVPDLLNRGYTVLITADHGNVEQMIFNDSPHTAHTLNKVPLIIVSDEKYTLKNSGKLGDIAPTILDIMNLEKPHEMTGNSLLYKEN